MNQVLTHSATGNLKKPRLRIPNHPFRKYVITICIPRYSICGAPKKTPKLRQTMYGSLWWNFDSLESSLSFLDYLPYRHITEFTVKSVQRFEFGRYGDINIQNTGMLIVFVDSLTKELHSDLKRVAHLKVALTWAKKCCLLIGFFQVNVCKRQSFMKYYLPLNIFGKWCVFLLEGLWQKFCFIWTQGWLYRKVT